MFSKTMKNEAGFVEEEIIDLTKFEGAKEVALRYYKDLGACQGGQWNDKLQALVERTKMPAGYNRRNLLRRASTQSSLPPIQDEHEPQSKIQDFCKDLNIVTIENTLGPLEVQSTYNGRRHSQGSSNLNKRKIRYAGIATRKNKSKAARIQSLSGRTKPKINVWNYHPELIDLTLVEHAEKLALKLFNKELKMNDETLEKTLERIYGGKDLHTRCFEFSQVGNCEPFAPKQDDKMKVKIALPSIAESKGSKTDYTRKKDNINLPSIFEVSYSSPVRVQAIRKNNSKLQSSFTYAAKTR
ncbi:hypothetical protein QZH41_006803 [Actinostola sp. cb2023]|nr:hypothetical protein QZH41_006803 [Actinostola sp. cb2023]